MQHKKVTHLIPAEDINMGGIIVKQALPTQKVDQVDPFLLLHHADFSFRDDAPAIHQGIGPHPHRGFSPVTFVISGEIHHRDSRGHSQVARTGEVQWMHAGAGIIHSERPSQALVDRNENLELIQLWINSPANRKLKQPEYQYVPVAEMSTFRSMDDRCATKVVAGDYNGVFSKIKTESDLLILWTTSDDGGEETIHIPEKYNTMIYLIKGQISISGYGLVEEKTLIIFDATGSDITVLAKTDAQFLTLSGRPIDEKITQHGPFVMNTQTQIMEAMRDYQMGKMGILIEE